MERKNLCNTSTGRIALTLNALRTKFQKNTLWLWLWIIIGLNIFPRLDYIFNFNLDSLLVTRWSGVDVFMRFTAPIIAFGVLIPWAFNQFVRNSKPMTFSLLPANLWEKVTALGIYLTIVFVGAFLTTYLSVLIDFFFFTPDLTPLGMSVNTKAVLESLFDSAGPMQALVLVALVIASAILTTVYTSIRFKKFFGGFMAGVGIWLGSSMLTTSIFINIGVREALEGMSDESILYSFWIFFILVDAGLVYLIARKLKRIEN